ncbi:MAG: amidohydrolase family protein, partial [Eubacteriales bacterium]|nr:amidohydrolase family protein [Eubacteriales bacterium]
VIPLSYLPLSAGLAIRAGMKEEDAWRAITLNPAIVAGIEPKVGSLEAGKDADIVIFRGNPLREIQAVAETVFINGEQVV